MKFSGVESKSLEKEIFFHVFTYSIKWASEIRIIFHVAVMQGRLRNEKKSVMHVQSCCFSYCFFFCRSRCHRHLPCLSSLFLWSRNFATTLTWRHTSPLYFKILNLRLLNSKVGIYASISCSACEILIFSVWYMCFCSTVTVLLCETKVDDINLYRANKRNNEKNQIKQRSTKSEWIPLKN